MPSTYNLNDHIENLTLRLIIAIEHGETAHVKALLNNGANKDFIMPRHKFSLLHLAAIKQNSEILQLLIQEKKVDLLDNSAETALHKAVRYDHLEHVKILLRANSSVNINYFVLYS